MRPRSGNRSREPRRAMRAVARLEHFRVARCDRVESRQSRDEIRVYDDSFECLFPVMVGDFFGGFRADSGEVRQVINHRASGNRGTLDERLLVELLAKSKVMLPLPAERVRLAERYFVGREPRRGMRVAARSEPFRVALLTLA